MTLLIFFYRITLGVCLMSGIQIYSTLSAAGKKLGKRRNQKLRQV